MIYRRSQVGPSLAVLVLVACPADPVPSETTSALTTTTSSSSEAATTGIPTTGADPTTSSSTTTDTTATPTTSTSEGLVCEPMAVEPCYSGDPNTEDVGPCRAGTRTCDALGAGFGACEGEVVPAADDCTTPEDEDCDGQVKLCPGAAYWAKQFGEAETQEANEIEVAADGTSVMVGSFESEADFGLGPLASLGDYDMFVAKFTPGGETMWVRSFGDIENQAGLGLAVDSAGRIAVVGGFYQTVDFGGGPLTQEGFIDAYVVVFDGDGEHVWSRDFGDDAHQVAYDVAITPADELVVIGTSAGTSDFGGGPLPAAGGEDHFIAKYTPDGEHVWSRLFGDATSQGGEPKVVIQPSGAIVAAGDFGGVIDFGTGPLPSAGLEDVYLATLDGEGEGVWARRFGDAERQTVRGLDVDPASGRIVISGSYRGSVDFGGGPLASAGNFDVFVAVFTADGAPVWSRRFGDAAPQYNYAAAFAPNGDVLLTGTFEGTLDFGGAPLVSAGAEDLYLARLAAEDGSHVRSARFGDTTYQRGHCLGTDAADNLFLAGFFAGSLTFDGIDLTSHGEADIFYTKLAF
ncbi:hypothetical protein [Nannocystis radixulma]|uniref:Uncharacterized protein n=1 Tax=Nannocystis radixulma TaxID=2995305 RepID=A0ABT5B5G6_9BACT|nr:hypothetical protein [Nannocystis radixulma]MDC0669375.1 hypothetical protein [Nannocystis radixulma]